jgi:hypothetical protein
MRIHTLLIAGALAGLMATAGSARALEAGAPVHTMKLASTGHKHLKKHRTSEKHLAITKDGARTRSAGGTVSKSLMGRSSHAVKPSGQSFRRSSKHQVKSSNASMKHHNKSHSIKSTKKYQ